DCVLIISTSEAFSNLNAINSRIIEVNKEQSHAIKLPALDYVAASLGVESGGEKELFWTIKPKSDLRIASADIRSFVIKRAKSALILPKDLSKETIIKSSLSKEVNFKWETTTSPGGEYELHFSSDPEFSDDIVKLDAGDGEETKITHQQLQTVFEHLECEQYQLAEIFWNVYNKSTNGYVSTSTSILYVDGLMTFTDVRGDESITYDVVRLDYSDGSSVVWLANNLRTAKLADGTDLVLAKEYGLAPSNLEEDMRLAYGNYYTNEVKHDIAPKGWRLPTFYEINKMFEEALLQEGTYDVLKSPDYYAGIDSPKANAWRVNLSSAGRLNTWITDGVYQYDIWGYNLRYCYLTVSDMPDKVANHDGGEIIWKSPADGAPIRLIYESEK
ncbi:MAG: FISUMP domain-containing protein, partial [Bacteroides sp.]